MRKTEGADCWRLVSCVYPPLSAISFYRNSLKQRHQENSLGFQRVVYVKLFPILWYSKQGLLEEHLNPKIFWCPILYVAMAYIFLNENKFLVIRGM